MRLLRRAGSPLYIHVQETRVYGRELTSPLLASAKLVVTKLTSAKCCREAGFVEGGCDEAGFAEVGCDEVSEVAKLGSRTSAKCGETKCGKASPDEVRQRRVDEGPL
jgi:uncharacterized low-complexity protein